MIPKKIIRVIKHCRSRIIQSGVFIPKPIQLNVFVTNRCNFSCSYCNRNIDPQSPGNVYRYTDGSDFKCEDLVYLLKKYPTIRGVSFVGIGEPFLNPDLLPMARYAKKTRKITNVITNGSLLHKYQGEISKDFDSISISLHGMSPEELQKVAGVKEHVFRQFVNNVADLVENEKKSSPGFIVRSSVVLKKNNLNRLKNAAKFCFDHNLPILDIQSYIPLNLNDRNQCLFNDETNIIEFIDGLILEYKGSVKINSPEYLKRKENNFFLGCTTFFNTLRVDGSGNVCGCCRIMIPKPENGNIHLDQDVWNNQYFSTMREKWKIRRDLPECCKYCPDSQ